MNKLKSSPLLPPAENIVVNRLIHYLGLWEQNSLEFSELHKRAYNDVYHYLPYVEKVSISFNTEKHGRIADKVGRLEIVEIKFNMNDEEPWEFEAARIVKVE